MTRFLKMKQWGLGEKSRLFLLEEVKKKALADAENFTLWVPEVVRR